jgi:integrase
MPDRITVYTWLPAGRKYYSAQWLDPITGKKVTKSTKQTTKSEADKVAGRKEDELNSGRQSSGNITWQDMRDEYVSSVFPSLKPSTRRKVKTTFEAVSEILDLKNVARLLPADLLRFQREIRARDVSEWTVKGHLSILGRVFRWAKKAGLLTHILDFPSTKAKHSKGRAPTGEEFDRIKAVTPSVVGEKASESWNDLLEGLWWSGLRLAEALSLRWDPANLADMWVDLESTPPMFHISAGRDKTKDRVFPVAMEFAELLMKTPKSKRRGFVFNPVQYGRSEPGNRPTEERVGKTIAVIGEDAGVKVAERKLREPRIQKVRVGEPGKRRWGKVELANLTKHATAHDLRRAFGFRWSLRVLPPVLMELMRHESIQTTMQFYVGRNAAIAAREAWRAGEDAKSAVHSKEFAAPNTLPNSRDKSASKRG